jgi:hypothetical protein
MEWFAEEVDAGDFGAPDRQGRDDDVVDTLFERPR